MSRLRLVALPLVVGILAAIAAWVRMPPVAQRTLWAEDSTEFIQRALDGGPGGNVFLPYAGYLQFVPRVVAEFVVHVVPVAHWALAMTAAAALISGAIGAVVVICAREVLPSWPLRVVAGSITVLLPLLPNEVLGNEANLHWIFLWLAPWLLLANPRTRWGGIVLGLVALVAALNDIQLVVFVPLLLFRWRPSRRWWVRAGYLIGVAAELVATLARPRTIQERPPAPPVDLLGGFVWHVILPIYDDRVPDLAGLHALLTPQAVALVVAAIVPFVALAVVALLRGAPVQRAATIAFVAGSLLLWIAAVLVNGPRGDLSLLRYGVVPGMLLVASALVGAQVLWSGRARATISAPAGAPPTRQLAAVEIARRVIGIAAVAGLVVLLLLQFSPTIVRRSAGPVWGVGIQHARDVCERRPAAYGVYIPAAPQSDPAVVPPWRVVLTCAQVRP